MTQSRHFAQPSQLIPTADLTAMSRTQLKPKQVNCSKANVKGEEMTQSTLSAEVENPFTTYRDPKTGRWVVVFPENQDPRQQAEDYKSAT